MVLFKLFLLEGWLIVRLWVDYVYIGTILNQEVEDVLMFEHWVIELMIRVLIALEEQSQWSVTLVIYLVGIVTIGLGKKHLDQLKRVANDSVVKSGSSKVILSSAVDSSLLESIVDSLKVL